MVRRIHRSGRGAFTLVELLVVIGIIAVLIGILMPALSKAREQSKSIQCQSNLRQFGMGIEMYAATFRGVMPQKGPDGSSTSATNKNFFGSATSGCVGYDDPSLWFNAIPKMLQGKTYYEMLVDDYQGRKALAVPGDNNIFECPSATNPGSLGTNDTVVGSFFMLGGKDSTGVIPGNTFKFNSSYVYNSKFTDTIAVPTGPTSLKITQCRPSPYVVTMVEKMSNAGEYMDRTVQTYDKTYPTVYAGKITAQGLDNKIGQPKSNWKRFTTRHRSGGHLLFADGHVAWFSWTETQIQSDQLPGNALTPTSDANQYNKMIWSVLGPIQ